MLLFPAIAGQQSWAQTSSAMKVGQTMTISIDEIPGAEYIWTVGGVDIEVNKPEIEVAWTEEGIYTVTSQYRVNGCLSPVSTMDVIVEKAPDDLPDIFPMPYFTPNDDGMNDVWKIINIEYYPEAKIEIYDRFHKLLASYKGSDVGWDGTYNGHQMPSNDYWYYIRCKRLGKSRVGHFILKR